MLSTLITDTNTHVIYEQRPDDALALYLHIPFCRTRCSYCAFNTYTGQTNLIAPYVDVLAHEITSVAPQPQLPVTSIYFGGGTPSLLSPDQVDMLLETCAISFDLAPDAEITLEANPGTVDRAYLVQLRHAGINRLSVGMQSAHASELSLFARTHTFGDVHTTVAAARDAGFASINLDLIYGIPHQTLEMWHASLDAACKLNPEHVSLYSLSVEDATPLQRQIARRHLNAPDPDAAADLYEFATDFLAAAGYQQYEISNWAVPGHVCRHNQHVWHNLPYLGFGAGAHGYAEHTRYANVALPEDYITRVMSNSQPRLFPLSAAVDEVTYLTQEDVIAETMIMGLRLVREGISVASFATRFGQSLEKIYGESIDHLVALGLLERISDQRIRLTRRGRLLGNRVFAEFI